MPLFYLPHTDGKTIWLRNSKRLKRVPDRWRQRSEVPSHVLMMLEEPTREELLTEQPELAEDDDA